jgi:hypothetical protein
MENENLLKRGLKVNSSINEGGAEGFADNM